MQQATYIIENPLQEVETGTLEVSGTGRLLVVNTGGSSSSEGGMGSGNSEDKAKGDLSEQGEKSGTSTDNDNDTSWDPIKKSVKEAEKANDKE